MDDKTPDYVAMFKKFFSKGQMTATYKPIFLRSLLDLGDYDVRESGGGIKGPKEWIEVNGDTITLDLNFIACRFIKYCWDLEHSFKLKQTSNPTDAAIITFIKRELINKKYKNPPSIDVIASDTNKELRKNVIELCIKKQVLTYINTDMDKLYNYKKTSNKKKTSDKIELHSSLIPFLRKHRVMIRNGLNYKLCLVLEKYNTSAPRIAMKVDFRNYPSRRLSPKSEAILDKYQKNKCFYCRTKYTKPQCRHIDHVIPFNYIFSTDEYNCVAACIDCNQIKTDRLPEKEFFDKVIDRNEKINSIIDKFASRPMRNNFSSYDEKWYRRTYDNCINDYHGVDSLLFKPTKYNLN